MAMDHIVDVVHRNARADRCSRPVAERGHRFVRFQGEEWIILGLYFAHTPNGQRELFYILRLHDGAGEDQFAQSPESGRG